MNPVGWRYHIPAYMIWSIKYYRISDSATSDGTIYTFYLEEKKDLFDWSMARFAILTQEQSKAVAIFLKYMAEDSDGHADERVAKEALDKYWKKFL